MALYPIHEILRTLEELTQYPSSCSKGIFMDMRCPPNTLGIFSKCLMNIWKDYVSSQKGAHHIK
jgi:hypothetical protein